MPLPTLELVGWASRWVCPLSFCLQEVTDSQAFQELRTEWGWGVSLFIIREQGSELVTSP